MCFTELGLPHFAPGTAASWTNRTNRKGFVHLTGWQDQNELVFIDGAADVFTSARAESVEVG